MDHYKTLGIDRDATSEQIKSAFRKLAMQHHPDRNGDEAEFKKINEAYDTLSNPKRKEEYDSILDAAKNADFSSFFNDPFDNFFKPHTTRVKRNLTTVVEIVVTLEEVLKGKQVVADVTLPSGNTKTLTFTIPPGVTNGQQVRYPNIGDDSVKDSPPGDLIVRVHVSKHTAFTREDNHLICVQTISAFDAMLGTSFDIRTLDSKTLTVKVPAGSQPGTLLSCKGEGLPKLGQENSRGNLYIKLDVKLPVCKTQEQIDAVLAFKEIFKE